VERGFASGAPGNAVEDLGEPVKTGDRDSSKPTISAARFAG
jgi:hypothetical protein